MAQRGVASIYTREINAVTTPDTGILLETADVSQQTDLNDLPVYNAPDAFVPPRPSCKMTQIRVKKSKGEYKLLVDGVKRTASTTTTNGVGVESTYNENIIRLQSFHAGPVGVINSSVLEYGTDGKITTTLKTSYRNARGHIDDKSERQFVGPLLITCAVEEYDVPPESVRIEVYQRLRVDGDDLPPCFLKEIPLTPHTTEDVTASCIISAYPSVHTHAPYVEIVDASNVRKAQASKAKGWWAQLFVMAFQLRWGIGGYAVLANQMLLRRQWLLSIPLFITGIRVSNVWLGKTDASPNFQERQDIIKIAGAILSWFFSTIDPSKIFNSINEDEAAAFYNDGILQKRLGTDVQAPLVDQGPPMSRAKITQLKQSAYGKMRTAVEEELSKPGRPQPKRVRFTLSKLINSLRRIRRIREVDKQEQEILKFGKDLQNAGFAEEKVLMEWITQGSFTEFSVWSFGRALSRMARSMSDVLGFTSTEPSRTDNNKESLGWVSANGAMITQGLDTELLRKNIAWVQIRIIVDDQTVDSSQTSSWIIEADEMTGLKAGWIDAGYSDDVKHLKEEIKTFERALSTDERPQKTKDDRFEWLNIYNYFPKQMFKQTGSESFATSGTNVIQSLVGMLPTTREGLRDNVHRIPSSEGLGLNNGGALDVLITKMEDNRVAKNNTISSDDCVVRLLPQRSIIQSVLSITPESFSNVDVEMVDIDDIPGVSKRFPNVRGAINELSRVSRHSSRLLPLFVEWECNGRELMFEIYNSSRLKPTIIEELSKPLQNATRGIVYSPQCQIPPHEILDHIQYGRQYTSMYLRSLHTDVSGTSSNKRTVAEVVALSSFSESLIDNLLRRGYDDKDRGVNMFVDGGLRRTKQCIPFVVELLRDGVQIKKTRGHGSVVGDVDPLFICYPCGRDAYRVMCALKAWSRRREIDVTTMKYSNVDHNILNNRQSLWPRVSQKELDEVVTAYSKLTHIDLEAVSKLPFYALQNAITMLHQTIQANFMRNHVPKQITLVDELSQLKVVEAFAAWGRTTEFATHMRCGPISHTMAVMDVIAMRPALLALYNSHRPFYRFDNLVNGILGRYRHGLHATQFNMHTFNPTPPPLPSTQNDKLRVIGALNVRNAKARFDVDDRVMQGELRSSLERQPSKANQPHIDGVGYAESVVAKIMSPFDDGRKTYSIRYWIPFAHGDSSIPSMASFGSQGLETMPIFFEDLVEVLKDKDTSIPNTDVTLTIEDKAQTSTSPAFDAGARHPYGITVRHQKSGPTMNINIGVHLSRVCVISQRDIVDSLEQMENLLLDADSEDDDSSVSQRDIVDILGQLENLLLDADSKDDDLGEEDVSELPALEEDTDSESGFGEMPTGVVFTGVAELLSQILTPSRPLPSLPLQPTAPSVTPKVQPLDADPKRSDRFNALLSDEQEKYFVMERGEISASSNKTMDIERNSLRDEFRSDSIWKPGFDFTDPYPMSYVEAARQSFSLLTTEDYSRLAISLSDVGINESLRLCEAEKTSFVIRPDRKLIIDPLSDKYMLLQMFETRLNSTLPTSHMISNADAPVIDSTTNQVLIQAFPHVMHPLVNTFGYIEDHGYDTSSNNNKYSLNNDIAFNITTTRNTKNDDSQFIRAVRMLQKTDQLALFLQRIDTYRNQFRNNNIVPEEDNAKKSLIPPPVNVPSPSPAPKQNESSTGGVEEGQRSDKEGKDTLYNFLDQGVRYLAKRVESAIFTHDPRLSSGLVQFGEGRDDGDSSSEYVQWDEYRRRNNISLDNKGNDGGEDNREDEFTIEDVIEEEAQEVQEAKDAVKAVMAIKAVEAAAIEKKATKQSGLPKSISDVNKPERQRVPEGQRVLSSGETMFGETRDGKDNVAQQSGTPTSTSDVNKPGEQRVLSSGKVMFGEEKDGFNTWNFEQYFGMLGVAFNTLFIMSVLIKAAEFVKRRADILMNRSQAKKQLVINWYNDTANTNDAKLTTRMISYVISSQILERRAFQQHIWSILLYHCAKLNKPLTLTHAVRLLKQNGSNGSLSHQSSVCLWNTERVLQSLLVAHGNNLIIDADAKKQAKVVFRVPKSIEPAVVTPSTDAYDRMRKRVSYQLRIFVHEHYNYMLSSMTTTKQYLSDQKDIWINWSAVDDHDLLDYSDNIEVWEENVEVTNVTIDMYKTKVKAAAYRYRNLHYCTVRFDPWMQRIQYDNVRQAELLNRESRAQFVYSVYLALALFFRITGISIKSFTIEDCVQHTMRWPDVDKTPEFIIKDDEPKKMDYINGKRNESNATTLQLSKNEIEKLKNEFAQMQDTNNEDIINELANIMSSPNIAKVQYVDKLSALYNWKNWSQSNHTYTEPQAPTSSTPPPLNEREPLEKYSKILKVACETQLQKSKLKRELAAMSLAEICLVLSAAT